MPKKELQRSVLLASHLDSPSIKLKPVAELAQNRLIRLLTEVYGSPLLHTWLDRDLCLAGRVLIRHQGETETRLVSLDNYPLIIPSLAIHLDRSVGEKGLILNKQDHLLPIATILQTQEMPYRLERIISSVLSFDELLSWELFLVPLEKARFVGAEGELLSGYRLDNLSSVFASIYALLQAPVSDHSLQLTLFWDHEEIGSKTYLGADSSFLDQILERICLHQQMNREEFFRLKNRSVCLSIDVAHGYHPNFADRFDPLNTPYLGDGVVVKTSAMQKYATNASTSAALFSLAKAKGWMLQNYASRSDLTGGGTVGSLMAAGLGIPTVDIGIATWAMHSIRETISAQDEISLCYFLREVFEKEEFFASS
jgi:aspartyl aminopeptidase